ncbi:MAG: hypothetical protein MUD12_15175 [Spirochaetes bacterium]|jgi:hypothetical protein|nr:hypothetical protein [Spirochaetota bacterium]
MKKALVGILIIGMSLFSCYDSTSDFSRVILLIQAPPTGGPVTITRLHVGLFAGVVSSATLISKAEFTPNTVITLIIPNTRIATFMVWGTDDTNVASHYGVSLPIVLTGQEFTAVPLSMNSIPDTIFNLAWSGADNSMNWSAVGIPTADYYELQTMPFGALDFSRVVFGPVTKHLFGGYVQGDHRVRIYSPAFDVYSIWSAVSSS